MYSRFRPPSHLSLPRRPYMHLMPRATPSHSRSLSGSFARENDISGDDLSRSAPFAPHRAAQQGRLTGIYQRPKQDAPSSQCVFTSYVLTPVMRPRLADAPHSARREDWSPTSSRTSSDSEASPTLSLTPTHIIHTTATATYRWPRFKPLTEKSAGAVDAVMFVEYRDSPPSPAMSTVSLKTGYPTNSSYVHPELWMC